jgi:hypothetical protein
VRQILESPHIKMIYRKFPKTASLPVTRSVLQILPFSLKCQVGQVHSAKATVNARFPFLDGISKATDNIRLQRHGKGGMDGKKRNVDVRGQV